MNTKKKYNLIQTLLLALILLIARPVPTLAATTPNKNKSNAEVAIEVIRGDWGNGQERKDRLTKAGYEYKPIQDLVNEQYGILYAVFLPIEDNTVSEEENTISEENDIEEVSQAVEVSESDETVDDVVADNTTQSSGIYSLRDLQFHGVIRWGGYKFTYYSQRV